tara:strand:- start:157 stop:582 length:426 start_codon:yes stop_codon:yes gene_type:complete
MNQRPSWDYVWMKFAHLIAKRSHDHKHKVGAIIVTDDNTKVLAVGYNGDQKGGANTRESMETGGSGFIHAEINALIKCDYNNHKKKIMYVTLSPCKMCAKSIINANIEEVVYSKLYKESDGLMLLKSHGLKIRQFISEGDI